MKRPRFPLIDGQTQRVRPGDYPAEIVRRVVRIPSLGMPAAVREAWAAVQAFDRWDAEVGTVDPAAGALVLDRFRVSLVEGLVRAGWRYDAAVDAAGLVFTLQADGSAWQPVYVALTRAHLDT